MYILSTVSCGPYMPRLNLNLRIKTVPVMAGTDATVYICMDYVLFTKVRNIPLHLILS